MDEDREREIRKKAIFDGMSKRGKERVLKIGYENWDPFEEPKDPRERIFGAASVKARILIQEFCRQTGNKEESVSVQKELFELCRGILQSEDRAKAIFDFCVWFAKNRGGVP